jgi:hypothetical protein
MQTQCLATLLAGLLSRKLAVALFNPILPCRLAVMAIALSGMLNIDLFLLLCRSVDAAQSS